MPYYRKLPVVIEAHRFCGDLAALCAFCPSVISDKEGFYVDTLEGDMRFSVGDVIIKGVHGEFYPCKADIFAETYELVERVGDVKTTCEKESC